MYVYLIHNHSKKYLTQNIYKKNYNALITLLKSKQYSEFTYIDRWSYVHNSVDKGEWLSTIKRKVVNTISFLFSSIFLIPFTSKNLFP